jgi:hypothetical protein
MSNNISVCIVAIAKMENHYIREWVEYHKSIGIDKIFLFDNNEIDGEKFEDVINDYISSNFVEIIDKRGIHPQKTNNIQAQFSREGYKLAQKLYDWIAIIDIDEFISFSNYTNIKDYLRQNIFNNFDCIRLCWKLYNDSNLLKVENENYSLLKRFTVWNPHKMGKTIYKANLSIEKIKAITGHGSPLCISCDEDGNLLECNERISIVKNIPSYNTAWINHYKTKTIEEFISIRLVRKDINYNCRIFDIDNFFSYCERTPEKEKLGKELLKKYNIVSEE